MAVNSGYDPVNSRRFRYPGMPAAAYPEAYSTDCSWYKFRSMDSVCVLNKPDPPRYFLAEF
eukprot:1309992-Rhodomonas_salina.1